MGNPIHALQDWHRGCTRGKGVAARAFWRYRWPARDYYDQVWEQDEEDHIVVWADWLSYQMVVGHLNMCSCTISNPISTNRLPCHPEIFWTWFSLWSAFVFVVYLFCWTRLDELEIPRSTQQMNCPQCRIAGNIPRLFFHMSYRKAHTHIFVKPPTHSTSITKLLANSFFLLKSTTLRTRGSAMRSTAQKQTHLHISTTIFDLLFKSRNKYPWW